MPVSQEARRPRTAVLAGIAILAASLFALLFRFERLGPLDFWWWMAANVCLVSGLGFAADRDYLARFRADLKAGLARKVGLGIISAVLLYGVFAAGRLAALKIFPFAAAGIEPVYGLKAGTATVRLVLLLGLVIGPGEELVWRGFLQENLGRRLGRGAGFILTALAYTLVHVGSGNAMLVLAAAVCGVFWGLLYRAFCSSLLNAVSHASWALLVFVVWPL
jgi:membrane protease YdiL (CAAX protease family)